MKDRATFLHVLMNGVLMGALERHGQAITFRYDDEYLRRPAATPLSVAKPLQNAEYAGRGLVSFLDGLLPDNDEVRKRWSRMFECPNQPFDLLAHVGEDCAGGIQLVRPDRLQDLDPGGVHWLDDAEIGEMVRVLRADPAAWLPETNAGQFSLAGAQSKFALHHDDGRWGHAFGAVPTTHIVKPASGRYAAYEVNEHLSLQLASRLGLRAAVSEIRTFDGEQVVVVERYDRLRIDSRWVRIHQEDFCQVLEVPPSSKYENDGGPSATAIVDQLRIMTGDAAAENVVRFADALAFNWLTGGTDAHAKNYSLLLAGSEARFAPLYDLGSALPYVNRTPIRQPGELSGERLKMAMRIGGEYAIRRITRDHWLRQIELLGLSETYLERLHAMSYHLPGVLAELASDADIEAIASPLTERFVDTVSRHATICLRTIEGQSPPW